MRAIRPVLSPLMKRKQQQSSCATPGAPSTRSSHRRAALVPMRRRVVCGGRKGHASLAADASCAIRPPKAALKRSHAVGRSAGLRTGRWDVLQPTAVGVFWVHHLVNRLYRRIAFGKASDMAGASEIRTFRRLQIRDTAECNSALRRRSGRHFHSHPQRRASGNINCKIASGANCRLVWRDLFWAASPDSCESSSAWWCSRRRV